MSTPATPLRAAIDTSLRTSVARRAEFSRMRAKAPNPASSVTIGTSLMSCMVSPVITVAEPAPASWWMFRPPVMSYQYGLAVPIASALSIVEANAAGISQYGSHAVTASAPAEALKARGGTADQQPRGNDCCRRGRSLGAATS